MMVVRRRLQIAPRQDVSIIWMIANLCLIGGLFASSILYGSAGDSLIVCTQYMFAYVFLPFIVLCDEETALILAKTAVFALLSSRRAMPRSTPRRCTSRSSERRSRS
jgi:hypothetical protein